MHSEYCKFDLSLVCALLGVVFATTCRATNEVYHNDLQSQERFLKKLLPVYTPPPTSDHILRMVKWEHTRNRSHHLEKTSKMYHNRDVIEKMAKNSYDLLSPCVKQIYKLADDTETGQTYTQYVADSSGRQRSGFLRGDYLWLGKYYECEGQTDGEDIVMRMCMVVIGEEPESTDGIYLGTCFPEACNRTEIKNYMELLLGYTSYATAFCNDEEPFTSGYIAAICIFSILAFFVLVGTLCETVFICLDMYYTEENPAHEARKRSIPAYLLVCFSLIKNTKTVMSTERKESTIAVLDGIRFLSMCWVILGHTLFFVIGSLDNLLDVFNYSFTRFGGQTIINATFSVDSFFFLSGLLVTYLALREMRRSGALNVPVMYLLRYLRLTPTVVLVMLFSTTLFQRLGEEPIFAVRNTYIVDYCKNYWWTNVLYINNLYPEVMGDGCISWVWYLANDWQFFLIAPIFLFLLYKYTIPGLIVMGTVLLGSIAATGVLAWHYEVYPDVITYATLAKALLYIYTPRPFSSDLDIDKNVGTYELESTTAAPQTDDGFEYFSDIYSRPWCRIGAYIIGMVTGYILYATNKKFRMHLAIVIPLWIVAFGVGMSLIYGWWGDVKALSLTDYPSVEVAAFYEAVKRPMWAFCLMWLTIACTIGYGGPINAILSWSVFMPLSRLTYCAYLVHPLVLYYMYTAREVAPHFRPNIYVYYFVAALVLSYAAAYVLHVLVEAPLAGLTKIIFYTPRGRKPWYAIFNINLKSNSRATAPISDEVSASSDGRGANEVEMTKSHEKSIYPPPYDASMGDKKNMVVYENPVEVNDEAEEGGQNERTNIVSEL